MHTPAQKTAETGRDSPLSDGGDRYIIRRPRSTGTPFLPHIPAGAQTSMNRGRLFVNIRLDAWAATLVAVFVSSVAFTWYGMTNRNPVQSEKEYDFFRDRYGPDHFSEREEEWMIRDFFQDRRHGVFVDVGANHYQGGSKTYYLETRLDWSGIAVEPQTEFQPDYAKFRPQTKFFPFFVSDMSNETARLYVIKKASFVASSDEEFVKQFGQPDEVRDVPTITLNDLLAAEGITTIDFLSMDIELHEPQALKGFDIQRFRPSLVAIEGLLPVRQQILDYFARNGYVLLGKYMWVDRENMYFAPLPAAAAP
jgi:FkbM family methyltransferase